MKVIATFDIGTTAVKGVLVSDDGDVIYSNSLTIDTIFEGEWKEQNPNDWYDAFCALSKEFLTEHCTADDIIGIVMSGQMQDLIMVSEKGECIHNAILYSDARAESQANDLINKLSYETIKKVTGNHFDGSMPFAKINWMKEHKTDVYQNMHKVMFSSKDYCVARLTDCYVTDVTSAATVGLMNIEEKQWDTHFLEKADIDSSIMPDIQYAHELAGFVTLRAASESLYHLGTKVYTGTGDAGATTLASGISKDGQFNVNIGTTSSVACVSDAVLEGEGVFNLCAIPKGLYINVVPFLNAGNVHKWITSVIAADDVDDQYAYVDTLLQNSQCGSHGLFFLPYLVGERFPVMDSKVKGCFIGVTPKTSKEDMARACLEGVAFSIKQGIDAIKKDMTKMTFIGGGARVTQWCQMLADMLDIDVEVCEASAFMPSVSIAASVLLAEHQIEGYDEFISKMLDKQQKTVYKPIEENVLVYRDMYQQYQSIYPNVKNIFSI